MTTTVPVDPANADQLRAWDGDEGAYWAAHADHFERALASYRDAFFGAASIRRIDRVLDVGCGTGGTTRHAARLASSGSALGVDLSSPMLEVARRRAGDEGLLNARFLQADAQVHPFDAASFDVAIGRTSAMFFADRVAGLANIGRALRPGGRLVLVTWQPMVANEWTCAFSAALATDRGGPAPGADGPGPFTLAEPEVIRSVLTAAGFTNVELEARRGPMWFGHDADDAFGFVRGLLAWSLDGRDEADRERALDALRTSISAHETREGVRSGSAAWIVSATRS